MSLSDFASAFLPDKKVALVRKIIQKTREGKIVWQKTGNGAAAYVPGALRMNFVETPWASLFTTRWVIFAVRDEVGSELLKVENQSSAVPGLDVQTFPSTPPPPPTLALPSTLPPPPTLALPVPWLLATDPLVSAVTELHNLVRSEEGKGGVDRAIDLLDKI